MAEQNQIQQAADRLWSAWESGTPTEPVRDLIGETDLEAAYAVQEINTRKWLAQGRRLVGRKIGLTSKVVQTQLGVDQPDYGMLFADMDIPDGEDIPLARCFQPKVEAEVAFVVGDDLNSDQLTMADILSSLDYALAAIEVVGSRVADWNIRIADTVADNASSGLYILGQQPVALGDFDPRLCGMAMFKGGEPMSVGAGAACLGSPLNATLWLAKVMAKAGRPLLAGDVVLSGALGPMVAANPGDVFEARIEGLGSVRASFAKE
ncbi:2-keto-4-pentenoate hydratase [Magnetospira sp. QH-2]|uniref:2-keto-4-pentenoate hydratase n=1 Tax=Magnetospira sp. (strain QH-2) TaxID=1288970 RepID=UPI0003E81901|nr:fumarylacetoacetate hydrolase family protein [Magnetospira sp. QH-2]CCQ72612.1 2-oxopent-4-enoate hydratase [Magnetospira sp. QH-2]